MTSLRSLVSNGMHFLTHTHHLLQVSQADQSRLQKLLKAWSDQGLYKTEVNQIYEQLLNVGAASSSSYYSGAPAAAVQPAKRPRTDATAAPAYAASAPYGGYAMPTAGGVYPGVAVAPMGYPAGYPGYGVATPAYPAPIAAAPAPVQNVPRPIAASFDSSGRLIAVHQPPPPPSVKFVSFDVNGKPIAAVPASAGMPGAAPGGLYLGAPQAAAAPQQLQVIGYDFQGKPIFSAAPAAPPGYAHGYDSYTAAGHAQSAAGMMQQQQQQFDQQQAYMQQQQQQMAPAAAAAPPAPTSGSSALSAILGRMKGAQIAAASAAAVASYSAAGSSQQQLPGSASRSTSPVLDSDAASAKPSLTDISMALLQERMESSWASLYEGQPYRCRECSVRFDSQAGLDDHMREHAAEERSKAVKGVSARSWHMHQDAWESCVPRQEQRTGAAGFFDLEARKRAEDAASAASKVDDSSHVVRVDRVTGASASDAATCAVCGDEFKKKFDDETESWVYVGAVLGSDGRLYHVSCAGPTSPAAAADGDGGSRT